MQRKEKQKGITLIALAVTIIILLILVGITVTSIFGDGIFSKSKRTSQLVNKILENAQNKIDELSDDLESEKKLSIKFTNESENTLTKKATIGIYQDAQLQNIVKMLNIEASDYNAEGIYETELKINEGKYYVKVFYYDDSYWLFETLEKNISSDNNVWEIGLSMAQYPSTAGTWMVELAGNAVTQNYEDTIVNVNFEAMEDSPYTFVGKMNIYELGTYSEKNSKYTFKEQYTNLGFRTSKHASNAIDDVSVSICI